MQVSFTIPTANLEVTKRDGSLCQIDLAQIPETLFAAFLTEGIAEYIRDSSSSALANAYTVANPDDKAEGQALLDARKAWGEANPDAVRAESNALMTAARDRLYKGERAIKRAGSSVDPLDAFRYKAAQAFMKEEGFGPVWTAWTATKGIPTAERMVSIAGAVESLGESFVAIIEEEARAMFKAEQDAAKRAAERRAKLAAKIDVQL